VHSYGNWICAKFYMPRLFIYQTINLVIRGKLYTWYWCDFKFW